MKKNDILKALDAWYATKADELEDDRKYAEQASCGSANWNAFIDHGYLEYKELLDITKEGLKGSDSPLEFMKFLISDFSNCMWEAVFATESGKEPKRYSMANEFLEILADLLLTGEDWEDS